MRRVYIEYQQDCIEIPGGETLVGRDIGCMLRFNDPSVSRRHLRFVRRESELFVEDLNSANGTYVNGRLLSSSLRVHDGDIIAIGGRQLIIRFSANAHEEQPSTLKLRQLAAASELVKAPRNQTHQLPVTIPPPTANQRCPDCGAPVSTTDDECARCHYSWGYFRPAHPTDVHQNPLCRRAERRMLELRIIYASKELEIEATSRDLSHNGVFVCSEVLEPLGTECQLTVLIDGGPPLQIRGIVRRVVEREEGGEATGLGVEFVEMASGVREWLRKIVNRMDASRVSSSD